MISRDGLIELNKKFDEGVVSNENSLNFGLSALRNTKDWIKQLAYLVRAILIDHIFREGNKRTAAALMLYFFDEHRVAYDPYKVDKIIAEIVIKNINNVEQVRRKIKDAIR